MDFNPIGGSTSPLLFDWEELHYAVPAAQPDQAPPLQGAAEGLPNAEAPTVIAGQRREETAACTSHPEGEAEGRSITSSGRTAAARSPGEQPGGGSGNGHAAGEGEILFRLAPAEGRLRPGVAAYGAPYDMADLGEGGAIAELLRKLQVETQED